MHSIRRYDWAVHFAAIALCAYFLARGVTSYVAGVLESFPESIAEEGLSKPPVQPVEPGHPVADVMGEGPEGVDAYKLILDRNIFNSAETGVTQEAMPDEMSSAQLGELGPAIKSSLDIKVLSILMVGEGTDRRSSAVVSGGKSKGGEPYYPGDAESFAPNVRLMKVAKDRIEFANGGRLEYAELQDFAAKKTVFASAEETFGKPGKPGDTKEKGESEGAEGGKIVIEQKEVDEALQNLDKLSSEVRIVPNFKDGKSAGMKVLSIKPGSIASKLGIRRGDVLEKVNGQELDIKRGMDMFTSMRDMKNFSLDVSRGGKNTTLEYEVR